MMLGLTPDEKRVVIFFLISLAAGYGLLWYKRHHPAWAPQLKYQDLEMPRPLEIVQPSPTDSACPSAPSQLKSIPKASGPINLNRAGARDLEGLPFIGPTIAKRIITFRDSVGGFSRPEELMKVKGIGPKKFNRLRDHVVVDR